MPKRSNEFQRLITVLNRVLAGSGEVTESAMLVDKSNGTLREVDILVRTTSAGYPITIGIEVLGTRRKADGPWVEKMRAKHQELETDVLVLVSANGMAKSAKIKAAFHHIQVMTLAEISAADWPVIASLGRARRANLTRVTYSCELITSDGLNELLVFAPPGWKLTSEQGTQSIKDLAEQMLRDPGVRREIQQSTELGVEKAFVLEHRLEIPAKIVLEDQVGERALLGLKLTILAVRKKGDLAVRTGKYGELGFTSASGGAELDLMEYRIVQKPDGQLFAEFSDASLKAPVPIAVGYSRGSGGKT